MRNPEHPISHFFPAFYGSYETSKQTSRYVTKYHSDGKANVTEMEVVDGTFDSKYQCNSSSGAREKNLVPDEVIFEFCLGEWAGAFFASIGSSDAKTENLGVKRVDYARVYKIGDRVFALPAGDMPMRIDVGGAGRFEPRLMRNAEGNWIAGDPKKVYTCSLRSRASTMRMYSHQCAISHVAEAFMKSLDDEKREGTVFDAFQKFYDSMPHADVTEAKTFVWPL